MMNGTKSSESAVGSAISHPSSKVTAKANAKAAAATETNAKHSRNRRGLNYRTFVCAWCRGARDPEVEEIRQSRENYGICQDCLGVQLTKLRKLSRALQSPAA